ncbi:MAG: carbon-nitrogen hydrolase family protein [Bdellovibrionales bacterium]|nr:carbon-nitrogen hydrolase family protein [Bdellovibrionales bacterium]
MMKVAMGQLCSSRHLFENLDVILDFTLEASNLKVDLIVFPENCLFMGDSSDVLQIAKTIASQGVIKKIAHIAKVEGINILLGGVPEYVSDSSKVFNTSFWLNNEGKMIARYRKCHLFDTSLPSGERFDESRYYQPGKTLSIVKYSDQKMGLSICYDLRFPELYRAMSTKGATVFFVPSAFTFETGQAHWHTLLKARAIENHAFVIAPAQCGRHGNGRTTYGHSLIVDPWGKILLDAKTQLGVHVLETDLEEANKIRQMFSSSLAR